MSILIKSGRVVTATDDYFADVYVEGESVKQIGKDLAVTADETIDASGKLVIPGGIDPHTHMDMPFGGTTSADDFESGTIAAAHGGTTTIVDFAIQTKGQSALAGLDAWHAKAEGKATIDYGFHMILTDMPDERLPEMTKLRDAGVTSYKLFMAYPGVLYVDDGTLYRAFRKAGEDGTRICMHAENGIVIDEIVKRAVEDGKLAPRWHAHTRPTRMEAEGVYRAIAIAEVANVPLYIVHLSCADALEEVKRARSRGMDVVAETCPQYLFLDDSYYDKDGFEGAKYVMTPALRAKWNQDVLWKGLALRHLETIATDHCPFCFVGQKDPRQGQLHEDPERRAGRREPHGAHPRRRRHEGPHLAQPVRRAHLYGRRESVRPLPEEGHDRRRLGRRHRHLRSGAPRDHLSRQPGHAPHARRLLDLRGLRGHRLPGHRALARPRRRPRDEAREEGRRPLHRACRPRRASALVTTRAGWKARSAVAAWALLPAATRPGNFDRGAMSHLSLLERRGR